MDSFARCLVPDGKPQVTSAHNSSYNSIYMTWKPPQRSTINGEFLGYRLAFKQREQAASESVAEVFLRDPSIEVFLPLSIQQQQPKKHVYIELHDTRTGDFHAVHDLAASLQS